MKKPACQITRLQGASRWFARALGIVLSIDLRSSEVVRASSSSAGVWLIAVALLGCGSPTAPDPLPNEPPQATAIEAASAQLTSLPEAASAGGENPRVLRSDPPVASSAITSAGTAQAGPCSTKAPTALTLGAQTPVDNRLVYKVASSPIDICVERALYPLLRGDKGGHGGHQLWATVVLRTTGDEATFDLGAGKFARFHGYRIDLGMVTPRFTDECDVWVKVTKE